MCVGRKCTNNKANHRVIKAKEKNTALEGAGGVLGDSVGE